MKKYLCYTKATRRNTMLVKRNISISLILCFVTFGIYYIYWLYKIDQELSEELGNDNMPVYDILLIIFTLGLYGYYLYYRNGKQINLLENKYGLQINDNLILYVVLCIFQLDIIVLMMQQQQINTIIDFNNQYYDPLS